MGFEVYVQCFGESEWTGISRTAVTSLFPIIAEESEPDRWRVRYNDKNSCHIRVTALASDKTMLKSLSVERPCGDSRLWEALISVLRMGSVVLFWPGGPPVVSNDGVASNLPKEMTEVIGPARSVRSAEDILCLLRET
jgi:hypothetical protein